MIAQYIGRYFNFGTCLRYLQDARQGVPIGEAPGSQVLGNLKVFFRHLDQLGLQVTIRASNELDEFWKELSKHKKDDRLSDAEAKKLRELMTDIRKTLEAELKGFQAYVVTPKRIDVNKLLQDVSGLLAPEVYDSLPEIARFDLTEAGKCIAFERPTAAAFHLLRATEDALREFYCLLVKQNRSDFMWGPMIADLRKRQKAKPHHDLLEHMDHIRKAFRNPTQHPEKIYDIQEVQDLWGLCTDALNRMGRVFLAARPRS